MAKKNKVTTVGEMTVEQLQVFITDVVYAIIDREFGEDAEEKLPGAGVDMVEPEDIISRTGEEVIMRNMDNECNKPEKMRFLLQEMYYNKLVGTRTYDMFNDRNIGYIDDVMTLVDGSVKYYVLNMNGRKCVAFPI